MNGANSDKNDMKRSTAALLFAVLGMILVQLGVGLFSRGAQAGALKRETASPQENTRGAFLVQKLRDSFAELFQTDDQAGNPEFPDGVAAINAQKSVYRLGETTFIGMSVLDRQGKPVCDAELTLTVLDPLGKTWKFTTEGNQIQRKLDTCADMAITNYPDYTLRYRPVWAGVYKMELQAAIGEGIVLRAQSEFEMRDVKDMDFDVKRIGPTRLVKDERYTMEFVIVPREDFKGKVVEYVPANFNPRIATNQGRMATNPRMATKQGRMATNMESEMRALTWEADWKAGKTYRLSYEFDAPEVSPDLETLGPLTLFNNPRMATNIETNGDEIGANGDDVEVNGDEVGDIVWREARKWQMAVDPGTTTADVTSPCTGAPNCDPANVSVGVTTVVWSYALASQNDDMDHEFRMQWGASTAAGTRDAATDIPNQSTTCSGADPVVLSTTDPTVDNTNNTCTPAAAWNDTTQVVDWDSGVNTCTIGDTVAVTWSLEFCSEAAGNSYDIDSECAKSGGVAGCWTANTQDYIDEWNINSSATSAYQQNDFEWFVTANSVTLTDIWPSGTAIDLAENSVLTQLPAMNDPLSLTQRIRIQMNITVATANLNASSQAFQLEYTAAEDCTTAGSWTAVGAKSSGVIWRLFDEAAIGDSTAEVNQISTSTVAEYYSEINPTAVNPATANIGAVMEWDWPVENNGATENTSYCFRMVKSDGAALEVYNSDSYPRLYVAPGPADTMRHGNFFQNSTERGFFWVD